MGDNDLIIGWRQIAQFLRLSERSIRGCREQLLSEGRIFYRRRKTGKRFVCAWQEDLRQWSKKVGKA